jgi:hypothetical protein
MKGMRSLSAALLVGVVLLWTLACMLFTPPRGPLKFDPAVLPDAQVGVPYEAKVSISDNATPAGEFSISEGTLPGGLTFEKIEGEDAARISGTPQEAGAFTFKVFVWCYGTNVSGQVGEKEYTLTVK